MNKFILIASLFCSVGAIYTFTDPLKDVVTARVVIPTILTLELRNGPARRLAAQIRRLCSVYETPIWGRRVPNGIATHLCKVNVTRTGSIWVLNKDETIDRDDESWLLSAAREFEVMYNTSKWPTITDNATYGNWVTDSYDRAKRSTSSRTVWDALSNYLSIDPKELDAVYTTHHWGAVGYFYDPITRVKRFFVFDAISMGFSITALSEVRTFRTEFVDSLDAVEKIAQGAYDGIVGLEHGMTIITSNIDDVNKRVELHSEALHVVDEEMNHLRTALTENFGTLTNWVRSGFEIMTLRDIVITMKTEASRTLDERRRIENEIDNIYEGQVPHDRISWVEIDRQIKESLKMMGLEGQFLPPREMNWKVVGHIKLNEFDSMMVLLSHVIVGEHHRSYRIVHPPFLRDGSLVTTESCNLVETDDGVCDRDLYLLSCAQGFSKFPICNGRNVCPLSTCCSNLMNGRREGCKVKVTPVNDTCLTYITPGNHIVVSGFCNCEELGENGTIARVVHVDGEQIFHPTTKGFRCNGVTVVGRNISLTSTMSKTFSAYEDDWVPALDRLAFRHLVNLTNYLPKSNMSTSGSWKNEVDASVNETGQGLAEIKQVKKEVKRDTISSLFNLPGISIPFLGTTSIWILVWNGVMSACIVLLCIKGNPGGYLPIKI